MIMHSLCFIRKTSRYNIYMATQRSTVRFQHIVHDLAIIIFSVLISVLLVRAHVIDDLLASSQQLGHLGAFVAGMFFTTIFTTAPAMVTLGEISVSQGIVETALWAALGAVIGDMLIFRFVRYRIKDHLGAIMAHGTGPRRFAQLLHFRFFRYLTFFAGGLIIASPLPDELGISLLGLSKMREVYFVPLSFVFNFVGVIAIGVIAASA